MLPYPVRLEVNLGVLSQMRTECNTCRCYRGPNILCAGPSADPEGCWGQGVRILSNTGLDRLKNRKATKPAFNIGPSSALPVKRHLKWRFAVWLTMARS